MRTHAHLLGLVTAFAIFFQFHINLPAGVINLNLADPFAMLALLTLALKTFFSKKAPQWRIAGFNWILILFSLVLLFAYVIGWMKIGTTQWALSARLLGWVVLLGYLSAGHLLVTYVGDKGILNMLEILAAAAILVIMWHVVFRLLYGYGFNVPEPTNNFEGFSGNRNAFAFQLLAVLALFLAYLKIYASQYILGGVGIFTTWRSWVPLGFLIAGIFWSASRAGLLTAAIMMILTYYRNALDRRSLFMGVLFASLLWCIVWTLQNAEVILAPIITNFEIALNEIIVLLGGGGHIESLSALTSSIPKAVIQSQISGAESNQERWETLIYGIEMWRKSPLIGEGLGVFIANSAERFGHPTVIHSTPIWILAEFGLIGAAILGRSFLKLWGYSTRSGSTNDELPRFALLLLLIAFVVFSQFHEILFQRIFWLIGGVLLGAPLFYQHQKQNLRQA